MKKANIVPIIFILTMAFIPSAFALEDRIFVLDLTIFRDGVIKEAHIYLDKGSESAELTTSQSDYEVILLDAKNAVIFQKYLQLSFSAIPEIFPGENEIPDTVELNEVRLLLKIPYSEDASKVRIVKNEKVLLEMDIKLCNSNKICEVDEGENFLSCPEDCLSGSKDNYCDKVLDGRCDPDCGVKELDIDCTCGNKICDPRENEKACPSDCKLGLWQRIIKFIKDIFSTSLN